MTYGSEKVIHRDTQVHTHIGRKQTVPHTQKGGRESERETFINTWRKQKERQATEIIARFLAFGQPLS